MLYRFQGPIKRLCRWKVSSEKMPSLYAGINTFTPVLNDKKDATGKMSAGMKSKPLHDNQKANQTDSSKEDISSDDESDDEGDESVGSGSDSDSSDSDDSTSHESNSKDNMNSVSIKPAASTGITGMSDTKRQLLNLSLRGKDIGGEGGWGEGGDGGDGGGKSTVETKTVIQEVEKNQRRVEREVIQKRKASEWDAMLDAGRVKKIKVKNTDTSLKDSKENYFQSVQDRRSTSGIPLEKIYHQEQQEREETLLMKSDLKKSKEYDSRFNKSFSSPRGGRGRGGSGSGNGGRFGKDFGSFRGRGGFGSSRGRGGFGSSRGRGGFASKGRGGSRDTNRGSRGGRFRS